MLIALAGMFLALVLSLGFRSPGGNAHNPRPARRRAAAPVRRARTDPRRSSGRGERITEHFPAPKLGRRERREMLDAMKNRVETDPKRTALLVREWVLDENRRHA